MRRALPSLLATVAVLGCSDLLPPPGVDPYEYRREIPIENGSFSVAFHWPREMLPLKIWIADTDPLRPMLTRAIALWQTAFVYGEFRAQLVTEPETADILVRNMVAPSLHRASLRLESLARQCTGATDYVVDTERAEIVLPLEVYVWSRIGPTGEGLEECYEITVLHEMGHALGILNHSLDPRDLMFGDPTVNGFSERDRATARAATHHPSSVVPVRR
ncbi:MAG: hypothetical protein AB7N73_09060 [Gemmatimonadales bacterium]